MSAPQSARPAGSRSRALAAYVTGRLLRRPTVVAAGVCLVSFAAFWTAQRLTDVSMVDVMVYRATGWAVRNGHDLYAIRATADHLPMTYPPFAALLFVPLTLPDVADMRTLATVGNLMLLVLVVHLALRLVDPPEQPPLPQQLPQRPPPRRPLPRSALVLLLASAAVWCEPVWTTLRYGQVNLLVTALVLWDFSRRPGHRWAGVGTGVAAGIKLTPGLFAVFLALCGLTRGWRLWRCGRDGGGGGGPGDVRNGIRNRIRAPGNPWLQQAAVASMAFGCTALLGAALLPRDSRHFWTDVIFRSDRVGYADLTDNQALRGVVARLLHTADPGLAWQLPALVTGVCGLAAAGAAAYAGERRLPYARAWATLACAVTALLVSPISWSHHWVWCLPVIVLLGRTALWRPAGREGPSSGRSTRWGARWWAATAAGLLTFWSYMLWWVPHGVRGPQRPELAQSPGEMTLSAVYACTGVGFLVLTAAVSVRALRADGSPERGTSATSTGRRPAAGRCQAVAKE